MEDALDGIFDENVAVASSMTQSFQLIIGCDTTRIFMDDKKIYKINLSPETVVEVVSTLRRNVPYFYDTFWVIMLDLPK